MKDSGYVSSYFSEVAIYRRFVGHGGSMDDDGDLNKNFLLNPANASRCRPCGELHIRGGGGMAGAIGKHVRAAASCGPRSPVILARR